MKSFMRTNEDVERKDAFRKACEEGDLSAVKSLISDKDFRENSDYLYLAASFGYEEVVTLLVDQGLDLNRKCDRYSLTEEHALHAAANEGHFGIVRILVERGADVNIVNRLGHTALMIAAKYGYEELVLYLIEHGADVHARDKFGRTALYYSRTECIIRALVKKGANINEGNYHSSTTPLMEAVRDGDVSTVSSLLTCGADVNVKDDRGQTALHFVSKNANKIIELLVSCGADINEEDLMHCTPLQVAIPINDFDVFSCWRTSHAFVKHGADVTKLSESEISVLLCSSITLGEMDVALSVIDVGIGNKVSWFDNFEWYNLLALACHHGCDSIVQRLILVGLNVSGMRSNGRDTPLHKAAQGNHIQCGVLLVQAGADTHIKNHNRLTALDLASDMFKEAIQMTLSFTTKKTVCVIGNACSGKSTLIASLRNENESFFKRCKHWLFGVKAIRNRTAGIDPISFRSPKYGNVVFFDFAGQHEYHGPHEMFMESLFNQRGSTVTIIVVVKATEAESVITQQLERWLHPLRKLSSSSTNPIQVIVAGSFMDKVKSNSSAKEKLESCYQTLNKMYFDVPVAFQGLCFLNCQQPYSSGFVDLVQYLQDVPMSQVQANTTYSLCWVISQMKTQIVKDKALRLSSFAKWIDDNKKNLPRNMPSADDVCKDLSSTGHYLYLPNKEEPLNSWLVLDLPAILHEVYGTLFSSSKKIVNEFGLLSVPELGNLFSTLDVGMIRDVLIAMDFCIEVDPVVLKEEILKLTSDTSECHDFLFFPALVSSERPKVFENTQPDQVCHTLCWQFQANPNHFISPRLIQTIILRLSSLHVFHCADTRQHYCSVWWNGLSWPTLEAMDIVVQVSNNAVIQVIGRSIADPNDLCQYLSQITRDIKSTIAQINPSLSGCAYIIHGVDPEVLLSDPSSPSPHQMYPLSIVLESTRTGKTSCFSSKPSSGQAIRKKLAQVFCGISPSEDLLELMYCGSPLSCSSLKKHEEHTSLTDDPPTGHTHPPISDPPSGHTHPIKNPSAGHTHPPTDQPTIGHTHPATGDPPTGHAHPKSLDSSPTDAELLKVLDRIPWWFDLAVGLGVSQDRVKYFRYSPTGGLDALCYWRDGHSGEQFPTSWKFLLDTIAERQGTTVADKIRKVFFPNQPMTGVKKTIDCTWPISDAKMSETHISGRSATDDPLLTTPTLNELDKWMIPHIALDWYSVGKDLEVEESVLKRIEQDTPNNVHLSCYRMFSRWLSVDEGTGGSRRLWKTVLMSIRMAGYASVVEDVERALTDKKYR